jgi:hypothetical protein
VLLGRLSSITRPRFRWIRWTGSGSVLVFVLRTRHLIGCFHGKEFDLFLSTDPPGRAMGVMRCFLLAISFPSCPPTLSYYYQLIRCLAPSSIHMLLFLFSLDPGPCFCNHIWGMFSHELQASRCFSFHASKRICASNSVARVCVKELYSVLCSGRRWAVTPDGKGCLQAIDVYHIHRRRDRQADRQAGRGAGTYKRSGTKNKAKSTIDSQVTCCLPERSPWSGKLSNA